MSSSNREYMNGTCSLSAIVSGFMERLGEDNPGYLSLNDFQELAETITLERHLAHGTPVSGHTIESVMVIQMDEMNEDRRDSVRIHKRSVEGEQ